MRGLVFFFFNDTATTEIYTLSLHDALPICLSCAKYRLRVFPGGRASGGVPGVAKGDMALERGKDRKSTRLNSSHSQISYAVFCLKKNKRLVTISPVSSPRYTSSPLRDDDHS